MTLRPVSMEQLVGELLAHYAIEAPPVPVEAILQNPAREMWQEVDLSLLDAALDARDPLMLRVALGRLLALLLLNSPWVLTRGIPRAIHPPEEVEQLARAVLMPRAMLSSLPSASLEPATLGRMFGVPRSEARQRLIELEVMPG